MPPPVFRFAPSPNGYLHLGHARTFWTAQQRAAEQGGKLILRNEDLDRARCRQEFVAAMLEDLRWFGLRWSEGPDVGGPFAPYNQSERMPQYVAAFETFHCPSDKGDSLWQLMFDERKGGIFKMLVSHESVRILSYCGSPDKRGFHRAELRTSPLPATLIAAGAWLRSALKRIPFPPTKLAPG